MTYFGCLDSPIDRSTQLFCFQFAITVKLFFRSNEVTPTNQVQGQDHNDLLYHHHFWAHTLRLFQPDSATNKGVSLTSVLQNKSIKWKMVSSILWICTAMVSVRGAKTCFICKTNCNDVSIKGRVVKLVRGQSSPLLRSKTNCLGYQRVHSYLSLVLWLAMKTNSSRHNVITRKGWKHTIKFTCLPPSLNKCV